MPWLCILLLACDGPEDPTGESIPGGGGDGSDTDDDYLGPGVDDWDDDDLSCEGDDDCKAGEKCGEDGLCVVDTCSGARLTTLPPVGTKVRFRQDAEFAVVDTVLWMDRYPIDLYDPSGSRATYDTSKPITARALTDITGGDFLGRRTQHYAMSSRNLPLVTIDLDPTITVDVGIIPVALAAGDVDLDGLDELVAIDEIGNLAVCHADEQRCDTRQVPTGSATDVLVEDVAIGDVDGDQHGEIAVLLELDGEQFLYVDNLDHEATGQTTERWWSEADVVHEDTKRLEVADLDGNGLAELVTLWYSWVVFTDDDLEVWSLLDSGGTTGSIHNIASYDIDDAGTVNDIAVTDIDGDDALEILVLETDADHRVVRENRSAGVLDVVYEGRLTSSTDPAFIAAADRDGDAPLAEVSEQQECEGRITPVMAIAIPPYDRRYSVGVAGAAYGDSESVSETLSDSVSLGLRVDIGYGADLFGAFGGEVSTKLGARSSSSTSSTNGYAVGGRYSVQGAPEIHGASHGAVVVSYGCFDAYKYDVDDPRGLLSAEIDGESFVLTAPATGGTLIWSSARYNAMAEELGLPRIEFPYEIGDVDSYPTTAQSLEGEPLDDAQLVLPLTQTFPVSDVGKTSFRLSVSSGTGESEASDFSVGAGAGVKAFGVKVGVSGEAGFGQSYSLKVGESAQFLGTLPPIPDDPSTPEDEYEEHRYSVTPVVYQQTWTDEEGEELAYYVMTYVVER